MAKKKKNEARYLVEFSRLLQVREKHLVLAETPEEALEIAKKGRSIYTVPQLEIEGHSEPIDVKIEECKR